MDLNAAKKLFLDSRCSTFVMGRESWPEYLSYVALNISKTQENTWRLERIEQLKSEYLQRQDFQVLMEMYDLAESVRSETAWVEIRSIIPPTLEDPKQCLTFIESLIGRKPVKAQSGYLFWTASLGKTEDFINLYEYADNQLKSIKKNDKQLDKRASIDLRRLQEIKKTLYGTGDGSLSHDENSN